MLFHLGDARRGFAPCIDTEGLSLWWLRTVFEAAGGVDGLRRLADAWHHRVMADNVVSHAFSHGFHPQHVERLAAYGPSTRWIQYVFRPRW
jgi:hypothetical protein